MSCMVYYSINSISYWLLNKMKSVERECHCLMTTLLLKAKINNITHESEQQFARFVLSEIKTLKKRGAIPGSVKNYFFKHINPESQKGFLHRWKAFFTVTSMHFQAEQQLAGASDLKRLSYALSNLADEGFAVASNCTSDMVFENEMADCLANSGCIAITASIMQKSDKDGNYTGVFPIYYLAQSQEKLSKIVDHIQCSGLGIALDKRPYCIGKLAVMDIIPSKHMATF